MVYDCISFFNELEVLEIRLNVLKDVVDRFVIVEAPWTHTGRTKELVFEKHRGRFAEFADRIEYLVCDETIDFPEGATERERAWIRENVQRNAMVRGLKAAHPDDLLLITDLDEIPNPEVVRRLSADPPAGVIALAMRNQNFFLNYHNVSYPRWVAAKALVYAAFVDPRTYDGIAFSEYAPQCVNPIPSATLVRMARKDVVIENAGWHFSYMGGIERIRTKLLAFAHTEHTESATEENIRRCLAEGRDPMGLGDRFVAEPPELHLPRYLLENRSKYEAMFLPTTAEAYAKTRFLRWWAPRKKRLHDGFISLCIRLTPGFLVPFGRSVRRRLGI